MNKHTQNLEEQIKALTIKIKDQESIIEEQGWVIERLNKEVQDSEREHDYLYEKKDEEVDELEDLLSEATEYFVLSMLIWFILLILNVAQFIINI